MAVDNLDGFDERSQFQRRAEDGTPGRRSVQTRAGQRSAPNTAAHQFRVGWFSANAWSSLARLRDGVPDGGCLRLRGSAGASPSRNYDRLFRAAHRHEGGATEGECYEGSQSP
jgi:hypothetical protein